ncbi:uncharacterized protein MONOS_1053 [Monocercomonoides exilis]|uniref:uncharacterized protein n=1 Tax=Monocercomonoides exilis TaxID=2049356 RepID=UPI003559F2E6|nr:hypothetical protein MONOS_1053 [Monocercomonoides exilis]|eukprot:MONOS_1053.1-p1 / transcript=MONOS_1053.1 / gene=MONOS_1053 / organism=Monocercomonoides_exilis_PA203 / gene_product=unspecified product / transcript_product=unspecified product / location=Mono_scaffold00018:5440-7409(-) / protein_length=548 / sequence_SO=supercontig / SO=protein_coding / is_pseudo=false
MQNKHKSVKRPTSKVAVAKNLGSALKQKNSFWKADKIETTHSCMAREGSSFSSSDSSRNASSEDLPFFYPYSMMDRSLLPPPSKAIDTKISSILMQLSELQRQSYLAALQKAKAGQRGKNAKERTTRKREIAGVSHSRTSVFLSSTEKQLVKKYYRKRLFCGVNEVKKTLVGGYKKVSVVVVARDVEEDGYAGGLSDRMERILQICSIKGIPVVHALSRRKIGEAILQGTGREKEKAKSVSNKRDGTAAGNEKEEEEEKKRVARRSQLRHKHMIGRGFKRISVVCIADADNIHSEVQELIHQDFLRCHTFSMNRHDTWEKNQRIVKEKEKKQKYEEILKRKAEKRKKDEENRIRNEARRKIAAEIYKKRIEEKERKKKEEELRKEKEEEEKWKDFPALGSERKRKDQAFISTQSEPIIEKHDVDEASAFTEKEQQHSKRYQSEASRQRRKRVVMRRREREKEERINRRKEREINLIEGKSQENEQNEVRQLNEVEVQPKVGAATSNSSVSKKKRSKQPLGEVENRSLFQFKAPQINPRQFFYKPLHKN